MESTCKSNDSKLGEFPVHYALAEIEVARTSDLGRNDKRYHVTSHLGRILKAGDFVLGYDFSAAMFNDEDLDPLRGRELPDGSKQITFVHNLIIPRDS